MQQYNYENIRKKIFEWYQKNVLEYVSKSVFFEISKNEKDTMIIDMTFEHCLAQLVVSKPDFAPYQFVSFEVMTCESEKASKNGGFELVYFFYDSISMVEDEVINALSLGIKFSMCYKPDELGNNFIGKKGIINIENKKLCYVIHPDDIKKITEELLKGEFVCIDTQFQYLVLKNSEISLRALPKVFSVK